MLIQFKDLFQRFSYKPKGIVHCGASSGQERFAYEQLGLPVIWVEAISEVYNELLQNIKQFEKQKAVHACIGEVDGEEKTFNVSNNEAQSSSYLNLGTHSQSHPAVKYVRSFAIKTKTLKTIISELGVDVTDWLLVADLQGAEMDMLKGAGDLLDKFSACYLEVNTEKVYENCALQSEIEEYLLKYNFVPREEFIYKQWGWGDLFLLKAK